MSSAPRLLYIDDDEGLCRLTARALSRRGYEVVTAASGPEGQAAQAEGRFDVVAVDHYMPGQDGLETLKRLLEQPDPPPVIYVTGSEESRIAIAAMKAGASDYVVKSIGDDFFDLLAGSLVQALERRQLRRDKENAEAALRESNGRLQALLKEVNHRVANSLQLVSSFVQMQAGSVSDESAKAALRDTQRRILAIAQVHRRLYTSDDVDLVDMTDYLAALVGELEETWSTPSAPRPMRLDTDPIRLDTDRAVSLGVIVNELVSNACKYAYSPGAPGEIRISLKQAEGERFRLVVEDDGSGFSTAAPARGTGLGRRLMAAMANSLKTEIVYEPIELGTRATLSAAI
ncbi:MULTISPECIES: sensor histidine kinase [unclassified Aureimonas]|uniref:sensor histidine kinase n=1 Tax=unclassified Aureimonas TaxID=2615206 RepID=UPI0006F462F3|nr:MULTISPECIES: histidine kinase dimerization/phosphoacceptor domain -containing protein [unclassified Aureimonas]KQT55351.1 two-component system sensor histidine kinase/response regulator [Aureimonas sp. Leaf427]KQT71142.1 two-component system sensor histidine kinase/response regulator [Aureimonas sp. Leaf460]